jgi:hypothetical protein
MTRTMRMTSGVSVLLRRSLVAAVIAAGIMLAAGPGLAPAYSRTPVASRRSR